MPHRFRNRRQWFLLASLTCVLLAAAYARRSSANRHSRGEATREAEETAQESPKVNPSQEDAEQVVREMCAYLANQPALRFVAKHTTEYVLDDGQKIEFGGTSAVSLLRPNRLRSDRQGEVVDVSLYYDGESIALYGRKSALYARTDAPKTMDEAIDFARDELGLEAPAADLLTSNPCALVMSDVVSGQILARALVEGVLTHHVALRGRDVDLQLWIEVGPRSLPRRYVITSKRVPGMPQHRVELTDWDVAPLLTMEMFQFVPPSGAVKIDFLRRPELQMKAR